MVRPGSPAPLWGVAGKAGYALSCVAAALVLAVSGFTYFVVRDVSAIGGSHAINNGPPLRAPNNPLMGVENPTPRGGHRPAHHIPDARPPRGRRSARVQGGRRGAPA